MRVRFREEAFAHEILRLAVRAVQHRDRAARRACGTGVDDCFHGEIIPRRDVAAENSKVRKAPSATVDPIADSTGIEERDSTPKLATAVRSASASDASVRG